MRRALAVAAALALLAACGDDDRGSQAATAPPSTVASSAAPASTPSSAAPTITTESTTASTSPLTTTRPSTTHRPPTTLTLPSLPTPVAPPPPGTSEPEVVLGTIEIPKIGVAKTLYEGITLPTLDKGPGHWPGTAMPGSWGQSVIAGHRTSHDRPFNRIDELVPGDEIIFTTAEGRFVYRVFKTEVVTPDALWITNQNYDHTAALFACHPPGSTAYRIVVFAQMEGAPPMITVPPPSTSDPPGSQQVPGE